MFILLFASKYEGWGVGVGKYMLFHKCRRYAITFWYHKLMYRAPVPWPPFDWRSLFATYYAGQCIKNICLLWKTVIFESFRQFWWVVIDRGLIEWVGCRVGGAASNYVPDPWPATATVTLTGPFQSISGNTDALGLIDIKLTSDFCGLARIDAYCCIN